MTIRNLDKYLDPPDEPEVPICESCGHEMPILDNFGGQKYIKCVNPFCPNKHTGIAKEMAERIVDQEDTIQRLELKIKLWIAYGGQTGEV